MTHEDVVPALAMGLLFTVAILLALAVVPFYVQTGVQAFENPEDPTNIVIWVVFILVFTAVILLLAWLDKDKLIQAIVLGAVFLTMLYVLIPILTILVNFTVGAIVGTGIAVVILVALVKHPEWYVVNTSGIMMAAGAAALFGISLTPGLVIVMMVALAAYDAIAVYRTKHMVSLADSALTLHLPIMLVVPRTWRYSFLEEGGVQEKIERGEEREAMFMGLGDVVIPAILVVSAAAFPPAAAVGAFGALSPLVVALVTMVGALVGLAGLMVLIQTGKAQAGLPLLNGGSIAAYVIGLQWVYGVWPTFGFLSGLL